MNQGGFVSDSPGGASLWVLPPVSVGRSVGRRSVGAVVRSVGRRPSFRPFLGRVRSPALWGLFRFCWSALGPVFGSLPGRCPFPSLSFGPKASICGVSSGVRSRGVTQDCPPSACRRLSVYTRSAVCPVLGGGTGSGSAFPGVTPGATHRGRHKPLSASQGTRSIRSSSCVCAARSASSSSMLSPCARHL